MPKAGGDVVVLVSEDNADQASNLAIDNKNLYWTSLVGGGTVFKLPLAGTSVTAVAEGVTGVDNGGFLTAGGGNVYFMNIVAPQTIRKLSSAGGAASKFADTSSARLLVADDTGVYVSTGTNIIKIGLDGMTTTTLVIDKVVSMAIEGNDLFWLTNDGAIRFTPKTP